MSEHNGVDNTGCEQCRELMIWYVAGKTSRQETQVVEQHLATCHECAQEQVLWHRIAGAVESGTSETQRVQPVIPFTASWQLIQARLSEEEEVEDKRARVGSVFAEYKEYIGTLIWSQVRLLRKEVWLLQLLFLGCTIGILCTMGLTGTMKLTLIALSASLCVASTMPFLYGKQVDVADELTATTVISSRTLFLMRAGVALLLEIAVNVWVVGILGVLQFGVSMDWVMVHWLVPLLGLSSMTLLMTIVWHPMIALCAGFVCWVLRLLSYNQTNSFAWLKGYEQIWLQPGVILPCALGLFMMAYWMIGRKEHMVEGE